MTHPAIPLSPVTVQSLGWALLHFVWQGAALAAVLSVLLACFRKASTRYALSVGALVLIVAAPVVTFLLLLPRPHPAVAWTGMPSGVAAVEWVQATVARAHIPSAIPQRGTQSDRMIWLVEIWFSGVVVFSLRAGGGFFLIARLKHRGIRSVSSELLERCLALQRRLGIDRAVRFCETRRMAVPAVVGLFRPVVLLPITALTGLSEAQLEAVIAHELAHIRRLDSFVNLFQVASEALLFYHPAVWWVSRRIRAEREHCCDDEAMRACGNPIEYARALTLMEERRSTPALAMGLNSTPLAARVLRLLGLEEIRGGVRSAGFATSLLCLAGALVAGNGFWDVAKASLGQPAVLRNSNVVRHAPISAARSHLTFKSTPASAGAAGASAQSSGRETEPKAQSADSSGNTGQVEKQGYIEQMRAVGLKDLSVDQVIALKTQGVTPDYVRQMHALGLDLNVEEIIAMRVQGVTPQYVGDMRAAGVKLSADQLVGMRVQGVTPQYVREMHELGFEPDAETLIGMRVQDVTPEYVKQMRATGLELTTEQLVAMRVQGVTPEYVKEISATGLKLTTDQLIAMRVQGVTPEYVKEISATGLKLTTDQLIAMRVQGVTPEYVKEMSATGLKLTTDQLIAMRVQGVTPEYVKALQAAGLRNLSNDDYIAARVQGITPEFVEKARQHDFQNLTLDKLIRLKRAGVL